MDDWIWFLLYTVGAQALGVGLAWRVEALSWGCRDSDAAVFGLNFLNLLFVVPFIFWSCGTALFVRLLIPISFWLLISSEVQRRQIKIPLTVAFFGALMQLFCFGWALSVAAFLLSAVTAVHWKGSAWFLLVFAVSAFLTYALLSLFRPTIYGTWNTWRQNFGKK